jgi:hypothetical protein
MEVFQLYEVRGVDYIVGEVNLRRRKEKAHLSVLSPGATTMLNDTCMQCSKSVIHHGVHR